MTLFWYLFFLLALNTVHTSIVVAFAATVLLGKFSKDVLTGFTQGITMGYLVLPGFDSWRMSRTYVRTPTFIGVRMILGMKRTKR